jgi:hypothetical protein
MWMKSIWRRLPSPGIWCCVVWQKFISVSEQPAASIFKIEYPEGGGRRLLWYIGKFVPDYWFDISEDSNFCIHHVENLKSHWQKSSYVWHHTFTEVNIFYTRNVAPYNVKYGQVEVVLYTALYIYRTLHYLLKKCSMLYGKVWSCIDVIIIQNLALKCNTVWWKMSPSRNQVTYDIVLFQNLVLLLKKF